MIELKFPYPLKIIFYLILKKHAVLICFFKNIKFLRSQDNWFYGQGESLENALNNKLFSIDGYISSSAQIYLSERLPYATSLWDGNPDEAMSIIFAGLITKQI